MEHTKDPMKAWDHQKKELLQNFSELTEDDVHFDYGEKDVMLNKLQVKLGKTRAELNAILFAL
jgi:hypothetical protein